ncbi:MAG TPA: phosphatase PAP2 family protein, partial [Thermomonospora sp.]|nr:phosphatase PAP2 family protein [Thermomonospora sp.]
RTRANGALRAGRAPDVTGWLVLCVLGAPLVFAAGYVAGPRLTARYEATAWAARLREARAQADRTLGGVGSFVLFYGAGAFLVTAVCLPLGEVWQRLEAPHDVPVFELVARTVEPGAWTDAMKLVTQSGNVWQTRIVGLVGALVLMAMARSRRWVPPVLIGTTILVEKYQQAALGALVDRGHPPTTLGTYPSGGCARLISIYGAIVFLLLAYTGAGRRARASAWALLAAFAFVEGYTRVYLNKHWITDVYGGWVYGYLLLGVVVFAGRSLLGDGTDAAGQGSRGRSKSRMRAIRRNSRADSMVTFQRVSPTGVSGDSK